MRISEILDQVEGLTKNKLLYWVRKGYLQPKKVQKEKIEWNDFDEHDLEKAKLMQEYAQLGYSSQEASKWADEELSKRDSFSPRQVMKLFPPLGFCHDRFLFAPDTSEENQEYQQILNNAKVLFDNPESLYFLSQQVMDILSEETNVKVLITLDSTASAIAGAIAVLSYQRRKHFLPFFSCRDIIEGIIPDSPVVLLGGKVDSTHYVLETLEELGKLNCKVEKLVVLFIQERERNAIEERGYKVESIIRKEELLDKGR